jgi:hypothetical protein
MVRRRTDYCFWEPDILETSVLTKYPWWKNRVISSEWTRQQGMWLWMCMRKIALVKAFYTLEYGGFIFSNPFYCLCCAWRGQEKK